jgi:hypothetical protein
MKFSYVYPALLGRIRVYGVERKLHVVSPTQQALYILDLWWTKWHWNWSDYFFFPLSVSFHQYSPFTHSTVSDRRCMSLATDSIVKYHFKTHAC